MKSILSSVIVVLVALASGDRGIVVHAEAPPLPASAVLDEWGARFSTFGTTAGENSLRTQIRIAIAQLAMFDAINAVLDGPYRPFASKPPSTLGASPEAAAITAAYVVALHEFPMQTASIETAYHASIAALLSATQDAIAAGAVVGRAAADAVLIARSKDNRDLSDLEGYTPGIGPGVWAPTPPAFGPPQTPFLRLVTPFGYDDPARFRPKPPPALDSKTYTADYNEIKDLGSNSNTTRTAEQSATAQFWMPSASALWIANIRSLASSMDLLTAARFEAIGIAAVDNSLIAAWDAKYTYMFWRPVTAIRAGDTDGNDDTEPDPSWSPFITTPSHPEYPAAHTTVGGSALAFYMVWFDTDEFSLDFKGNAGVVRHYDSAAEIRAEEANARVWGGMHWRNSTKVGAALGRRVGRYTAIHLLKPIDE
jgi:hypothetical protein